MSKVWLDEKKSCKTWKWMFTAAILFAIVAVTFSILSAHRGSRMVSVNAANKMVSSMTHGIAHVTKTFPGPDGLTGVVIHGPQGQLVAWMTNQGSAIIVGNVVNRKNQNITALAAKEYMNKPTSYQSALAGSPSPQAVSSTTTPSTAIAPATGHALNVSDREYAVSASSGESVLQSFVSDPHQAVTIQDPNTTGAHTLYAFIDPNCIYCHEFFQMVEQNAAMFRKAGVRVVFVPVAILKQSSAAKAAEIVAGGWNALLKNETSFNVSTEEGGLSGQNPSSSSMDAAHLDTEILNRIATANHFGMETPLLVWKASNQHVYYLNGSPGSASDMAKILSSFKAGWKPAAK